MARSPWWSRTALIAATTILIAACGDASTATPAATGAATAAPTTAASEAPFTATSYPETGEAPCGTEGYTGQFKKISALDRRTVEFQLCNPDVAFLSKIAFSAFGIDDADYLAAHAPDKSYLDQPNGTGPYMLSEWSKGNRLVLSAYDGYWGTTAYTCPARDVTIVAGHQCSGMPDDFSRMSILGEAFELVTAGRDDPRAARFTDLQGPGLDSAP